MRKRILVVDDEETIARLVATVLRSFTNHEVESSSNPYEAYARASSSPYDLLISDVQMPGLDGGKLYLCLGFDLDSCERRENAPKLLLMSGALPPESLAAKSDFVGGTSFLQKPFSPAVLVATVQSILAN